MHHPRVCQHVCHRCPSMCVPVPVDERPAVNAVADSTELMRRALAIACAALDEPPSGRLLWAAQQCGEDLALHTEVALLLAADEAPEFSATDSGAEPVEDPWPGRQVGRYRIGARIGSGGMGTVYRALPESGLTRQPVALKLIKRGMDSEEIVRRFLREREILARLDHPHIARLLDGGITEEGRPWFALELVEGQPLMTWCDQRRLGIDARIALFRQVCDAVDYAHRNLVVHRDLKPGNVLVTADGQAKLLDFGIAKLIDASGAALTRSVLALMTPEYAAPEQFERGHITTQTDVYLLGLLLAELLTGRRSARPAPGDPAASTEPQRLDAAFAGRGAARDPQRVALAASRGSSIAALARALRGDLDRIVRRATAWEPARRYASAAALAADLERHRCGQPVLAMGDSLRYRLGKFLRRHRAALLAAVAVLAALALGTATTLRESRRLRIAQAHTETTLALLEDVFLGADPYTARGGNTRATDLLAGVDQRIRAAPDLPPALAARLWFKLGVAHVSLDERASAEAALEAAQRSGSDALACRAEACIEVDAEATRVLVAAAGARLAHYRLVVDGDANALPQLSQAIAELRAAGPAARHELAQALQFQADHAFNQGQYAELDALSAESVALERADAADDPTRLILALAIRASLLRASGQTHQALASVEDAHGRLLDLGERAPLGVRLYVEQQYGGTLAAVDRAAEAAAVLQAARDRALQLRGAGSGMVHGLSWALADAQIELGQFDLAAAELTRLLSYADAFKGANRAAVHNALGTALLGAGQAAAALTELARADDILCPAGAARSPPCLAIALNQIDAILILDRPRTAATRLQAIAAAANAAGGRAAMRWQLLKSRLHLRLDEPLAAASALAASRVALASAESTDAITRAHWLRQEAAIALARGERGAALTAFTAAEQQYRTRWSGEPAALLEVHAMVARLQRAAVLP